MVLNEYRKIDLKSIKDERGELVPVEFGSGRSVPFTVRRAYYLFGLSEKSSRGYHAHRVLEQLLVCVSGSCRVLVESPNGSDEFLLNSPTQGVYMSGLVWREMHGFSEDCVLVVFASEHYDESDYIRNYSEFKELIGNE